MTIKEKLNIKAALIKDYTKQIHICRDLKRAIDEKRKELMVVVGSKQEEDKNICIKMYCSDLSDLSDYDRDHRFYTYEKECVWLKKTPCPLYGCPYHAKNRQYKEMQIALMDAQKNKKVLFNKIFQRIR